MGVPVLTRGFTNRSAVIELLTRRLGNWLHSLLNAFASRFKFHFVVAPVRDF